MPIGHVKGNKERNSKPDKRRHLLGKPAHLFHLSFYVPTKKPRH